MGSSSKQSSLFAGTRRKFVQYGTMAAVGAQTLLRTGDVKASIKQASGANDPWPEMQYRTLGRTGFKGSTLVFGCGAALSGAPRDDLLDASFEAGVNVYDTGFKHYYRNAEKNMIGFLKRNRDDIFLISKGFVPADIAWDAEINTAQAKQAATTWAAFLDESLAEMQQEHVDAYYYMGINNASVMRNEEIYRAFENAKAAGKVDHLGVSTHENAANVLQAAIDTGWFSLAQIAITPAGWYDWDDKAVLPDSPVMKDLQGKFAEAREAGIGMIAMKTGRFLAGRKWLGWDNPEAFDEYYEPKLMSAGLNHFQRAYAFVLEHGMDAVNADMQEIQHLKENFIAAATSKQYFDLA